VLEREHLAAEDASSGGEPDRRVTTRAADLEHLAVVLRRREGEEEPARRRGDGARANRRGQAAGALVGVFALEALEDGQDLPVQHAPERNSRQPCPFRTWPGTF